MQVEPPTRRRLSPAPPQTPHHCYLVSREIEFSVNGEAGNQRPHCGWSNERRPRPTGDLCVDDEMMYRLRQDATAINSRMGSGGRLTSRRCHEITWPSSEPASQRRPDMTRQPCRAEVIPR
ncbi:hypothetical protein GFL80_15845 [Rhizobium leguminosarum bv. viciae]|nr:hypothetical protein [Rhizobium leguminosarum bv. viciae]NKK85708.1 hypothetical protein [Rhizobium leguminosarum bv. viciae]